MNMPLPPKSCGQIVFVGADGDKALTFRNCWKGIGSNSAANFALKSSTTSVVSARVNVQTEKINLPPGFTLGATFASKFF